MSSSETKQASQGAVELVAKLANCIDGSYYSVKMALLIDAELKGLLEALEWSLGLAECNVSRENAGRKRLAVELAKWQRG